MLFRSIKYTQTVYNSHLSKEKQDKQLRAKWGIHYKGHGTSNRLTKRQTANLQKDQNTLCINNCYSDTLGDRDRKV